MPLEAPEIDEAQVQQVLEAADQAPDERVYPGMRYDDARSTAEIQAQQDTQMDGTRRYAAVHAEGPGAAEVMRRRAEIDAWQEQMREEARQKAEAERAARLAQAERERRAAQEAYEAEQARLAQAEYERQLAEYERQRAQYERDLAQYEREKAEYEAAMARQAEEEAAAQRAMQESAMQESVMQMEAAQELAPESGVRRRRRSEAYSDYVEGETVTQLPDAPEWKPMEKMEPLMEDAQKKADAKAGRKSIWRSGMEMMAHMMEEEEQDITGIASLPPRVDMHEAYRPAKKPGKQ